MKSESKAGALNLTEHNDILTRWNDFYSSLYQCNRDAFEYFEETEGTIPPILLSELLHALKVLLSDKAPGPDGITVEMLRAGGHYLHNQLLILLNTIIETRQIP